ncbi:hypothetical protein ASPBRDRAFT_49577 [Aspergillus brasiliensis CBS 101740]|uniref:BZIP domain-containing protein n=1 Tax=Aspergillus brasiliensis (strain CBS 101740 / IMI 381727 / IBT 21946) TaxID=767769 RepID=A0A1L9U209_ASPBC|nr:hypothetical protein ASPBRDRAFT_49577 [Aspergillus brasiliensis CBS 101740]
MSYAPINIGSASGESSFADSSDPAQVPDPFFNWERDELPGELPAHGPSQWDLNISDMVVCNSGSLGRLEVPEEANAIGHPTEDRWPVSNGSNDEDSAKRKEKNRLAQKAFRQRKELYIKTLERKVNELESQSTLLQEENRRLQAELAALLPTEKTSGHGVLSGKLLGEEVSEDSGSNVCDAEANETRLIRISRDARTRLVDARDTCQLIQTVWELIQANRLFDEREVDLGHVYERLLEIARVDRGDFTLEDGVRRILEEGPPHDRSLL